MCVEAQGLRMIRSDLYDLLDGWLFWYDADDMVWKAALQEDYIKTLKYPGKLKILSATGLDQLIEYITEDPEVN